MSHTRTRFAPSPTGFMHVGGVRTALFAWALARSQGGEFLLRIEDTDQSRTVDGAIEHISESLHWLGLVPDEGPLQGGGYGPYIQSERLDVYRHYAENLIKNGHAYIDPYTPEELSRFREESKLMKQPFLYRRHRPEDMFVPDNWYAHQTLRFKTPEIKSYEWHDEVRGRLSAGEDALDDFVLIKADGFPTYNFAHVVDDHEMQISHIIRGEEFIASTPRFLSLYDALQIPLPSFVTVPPILNQNGGKKLSKRDGAKDVLEYQKEGYLVDAVINFLASLGWNDGSEQEIFTAAEIVEKFSLNRIQKAGAKFDDQRLIWMNGHHIRNLSVEELFSKIDPSFWPEEANAYDEQYRISVLGLVQERLKFFGELGELTKFFFKEPDYSATTFTVKKLDPGLRRPFLEASHDTLSKCTFTNNAIEEALRQLVEKLDTKTGVLFGLLRIAVTGQTIAPGLFETMTVLGKEKTLSRIQQAIAQIDTA